MYFICIFAQKQEIFNMSTNIENIDETNVISGDNSPQALQMSDELNNLMLYINNSLSLIIFS